MSSIRKSASFRSRIPVRRTKPTPRRCYSPPPLSTASSSREFGLHQHNNNNNNSNKSRKVSHNHKNKLKHVWPPNGTTASGATITTANAAYSSSSYSSSDESQESEAPLQVIFHNKFCTCL